MSRGREPPGSRLASDLPYETHFERVRTFAAFTPVQNIAGAPAISLPLGCTAAGLPIGVQLAAARDQDERLLALAMALEAATPWPLRPRVSAAVLSPAK